MKLPFQIAICTVLASGLVALSAAFGRMPDCQHAHNSGRAESSELKLVKVTSKKEGALTRFFVENKELCEVTMTFDFHLVNLSAGLEFPYTTTFPPGEKTEAFVLRPVEQGAPWEYSYTNYFKLGSNCCEHDDRYVYQLPYAPGAQFKVTQAYGGSFSHKGSNKYAIDWKMPEGTLIHAARGGLIVKIKGDSDRGGPSMSYDRYNNYVLIRHDDGTLGHYCHLQKGGILVRPGQIVATGEPIAHSGNTGFSSGPHLHFSVFKTKTGKQRESVPVRFMVDEGRIVTLAAGRRYRSPLPVTETATQADFLREPAVGAGSAGTL